MFKFRNQEFKGYLLLVLSAFFACFYFISFKFAVTYTSPSVFISGIFVVGLIYSLVSSLIVNNNFKINKSNLIVGLHFGLFAIIGNYSNGKSLEYISPSITSLFLRTQILFLFIGGYFFFKEKISFKLIIGTFISVLGAYILSTSDGLNNFEISKIVGILWSILAAISFASIAMVQKYYSLKIHPPTVNSIRFILASIIMLSVNNNLTKLVNLPNNIWLIIIIASVFGPIFSRLLIMYALKFVPISKVPIFSMLTPLFTVLLAYIILNEALSIKELIGGLIILLGLIITLIKKK